VSEARSEAEEEVLATNAAFYAAFAARDLAAMGALWSSSRPVACIHPGWAPLRGRSRVMQSWRAVLANPRAPKVACTHATAHVVGDAAFVICFESVEGERLVATNYFAKEAGAWRMVHHQAGPVASGDPELDETPVPDPSTLN
jgi:ketosteroid isomerase-like protein